MKTKSKLIKSKQVRLSGQAEGVVGRIVLATGISASAVVSLMVVSSEQSRTDASAGEKLQAVLFAAAELRARELNAADDVAAGRAHLAKAQELITAPELPLTAKRSGRRKPSAAVAE